MNWYLNSGKDSDVVTSTRIRYARKRKRQYNSLYPENKRYR